MAAKAGFPACYGDGFSTGGGGLGLRFALGYQGFGPQAVKANNDLDTGNALVQAATTFSAQGKDRDAIQTLLNVPATSQQAPQARQQFADLVQFELGSRMATELDALNLNKPPGKAKRSLAGLGVSSLSEIEAKTKANKIQTKFGYSPVWVYSPNWPAYRQPTDTDLAADSQVLV